jgi:hypothetical protein
MFTHAPSDDPHDDEYALEATLSNTMSSLDLVECLPVAEEYDLRSAPTALAVNASTARAAPAAQLPTVAAELAERERPLPGAPQTGETIADSETTDDVAEVSAVFSDQGGPQSPSRDLGVYTGETVVPPSPGPPEADPAKACSRSGLTRLPETAAKLPSPAFPWVAATVHCIAKDSEISGSDESLTGITTTAVALGDKPNGSETGLKLRFNGVMGPQGDLICRIARKVMEFKGKKDMFQDWSALRKHLCDDKSLRGDSKIKNFAFLWSGSRKGGNDSRDPTQTYYERRFTADLDDDTKFTEEQHKARKARKKDDRKNGGGGNPGLMAYCGSLLQRDEPGLYERAKEAALMDICNGLQVSTFEEQRIKAEKDAFGAEEVHSRKKRNELKANVRNAATRVDSAKAAQKHPDLLQWVASRGNDVQPGSLTRQRSGSSETDDELRHREKREKVSSKTTMQPQGSSCGEVSPPGEDSPQGPQDERRLYGHK